MKPFDTIVFDADGTLFDTFELIVSAYAHVSKTHNLPVPSATSVRSMLGSPMPEMFAAFYPGINMMPLLETNKQFVSDNIVRSQSYEGVAELLVDLSARGFKLAVLTSGTEKIMAILEHHDVLQYFSSVVHADRITHPKPDPEGFLLACQECGTVPERAIMVGDTVFDIETAHNAGASMSIALTHGFGRREDLIEARPDYIVDSILQLSDTLRSI